MFIAASRRSPWVLIGLLFAVLLITRLPVFVYPILDEDEAIHATIAAEIVYGGQPYINAVDNKTPLLWYQYALMFKFFGMYNMLAVHAFTTLLVMGTALILQRIGTRLKNGVAGWVAAFAYVIFSTASFYKILASNFEIHLLFFEVLAVWAAVRAFPPTLARSRSLFWFMAGLATAGSILTKQQGGMIAISLPLAALLYTGWRGGRILLEVMIYWLGTCAVLVLFALYAQAAGFWDEMIYWTLTQARGYIHSGFSDVAGWARAFFRTGLWMLSSLPLWLAAFFLLKRIRTEHPARIALILWVGSCIPVAMGGRFFAHYFLLTLPGLCLGAGLAWEYLSFSCRRTTLVLSALLAVVFLTGSLSKPLVQKWEGHPETDFAAIGAEISSLISVDDRIFVWGWSPEIYLYSHRRPATRFVFCDALSGRVPGSTADPALAMRYLEFVSLRAWDLLWDDFLQHPPRLIVDGASANLHEYAAFPLSQYRLQDLVTQYYEPVAIAGMRAYRLKKIP